MILPTLVATFLLVGAEACNGIKVKYGKTKTKNWQIRAQKGQIIVKKGCFAKVWVGITSTLEALLNFFFRRRQMIRDPVCLN